MRYKHFLRYSALGAMGFGLNVMAADFFVATNGSDVAAGTSSAPLATLECARKRVRELKRSQPDRAQPIVVVVRGGTYYLAQSLTFTHEDSGTTAAPIIYEAAVGEEVVLSAGVPITGWQTTSKGRWQAKISDDAAQKWVFSQIYVNDQRRFRPAWPRSGYSFVAATSPLEPDVCPDRFVYGEGDILPTWQRLDEKEVCLIHSWNLSRFTIKALEAQTHTVVLSGRTWHASLNDITPRNWYRVENVVEAFDQPGQWYLNREPGELEYIPLPGEDPATAQVIAPRHDKVIVVIGDAERGVQVENLIFRGLTFAHNNWNVPTNGYSYAQAEAPIVGAFTARFARHIRVEGCVVRHTGSYGVEFGNGCCDCVVVGCEMFDLGAGGVKIGIAWEGEGDARNYAYNCVASNNLIAYGGRVHPAGVGVWIGHAASNRVERNTIHDLYYSAISVGWKWTFGANPAHDNIIEHNRIDRIGQGVLSDMGGIYMLGEQRGTCVRGNVMHNISRARYGGWGIYFDSGSSHILVENNLVYDTEDGGLIHGAASKNNIVRSNILACGQKNQLTVNTSPEGEPLRFEHNAVVWQESDLFLHAPPATIKAVSNLYWRVGQTAQELLKDNSATARRVALESDSIVADPGFVDLVRRDFTLKPESPLQQFGFVPAEWESAGIVPRHLRTKALPLPPEAYVAAPMEPELPLREDFESIATGQGVPGWHLAAGNRRGVVKVTDEVAASGKRSLRVVDELENYEPHLYIYAVRNRGSVTFSFDLRLGRGAQPSLELRDVDPWYASGPLITVDKDGWLRGARGKALLQLPYDVWVHLELTTKVGVARDGFYEVRVGLPGQSEPQLFANLPCMPGFKTIGWIGFCSSGALGSIYEIDNLLLTP